MTDQIRVMSFNLLYGGYRGTPHALENRKEAMLKVIYQTKPDVIGCQEAMDSTRAWLAETLAEEYSMVGCGRNADCCGEGCPVLWRKKRFVLLGLDTVWLSDTPRVPGSRYSDADQSPCPRLAHFVYLHDYAANRPFLMINTHLDHYGPVAREKALELLSGRIA